MKTVPYPFTRKSTLGAIITTRLDHPMTTWHLKDHIFLAIMSNMSKAELLIRRCVTTVREVVFGQLPACFVVVVRVLLLVAFVFAVWIHVSAVIATLKIFRVRFR